MQERDLNACRAEIDEIDRQLVALLESRLDAARDIAAYKRKHDLPVLDAAREHARKQAIDALCRAETRVYIQSIYEEILASSRSYQAKLLNSPDKEPLP